MAALGYLISPVIQVEDINGKPLVGGRIRVYRHGTQIQYITHKDWSGDLNPAEVRLDARGMCILIAEDDNLYDIYCEDANYVEQWSRLNVAVGGGAGGAGTVTDITSSDGSVTIIRTGDTFDLSVTDAEPSAIIVQSETRTANGPFIFTSEPINVTGSDIGLVGARIACKKRWYHYDATVMIDWQGTPENRTTEITVSAPDCYERVEFDLSYPHTEWLTISADYEVQSNGGTIPFGISGMADDGMYAQLTNVSVHSLVGRVSTGSISDIYTDNTLTGDGTPESPLSVVGAPFQQPIITYNGCGISLNSNVIEADLRTDTTLDGAGTSASPLGVAAGAIGRQQLSTDVKDDIDNKISSVVTDGVTITGTGVTGDPLVAVGGGSPSYTAGDAIDLSNDEISVKYGDGLAVNQDNELEVQLGDGLTFEDDGGVKVITVDSDVSDVVATVQKLKHDLDTQITVNFDMPNITHTYDFADRSVSTLANGACMLCQAFTIPINHDIRVATIDEDEPTLLGIYAKQQYNYKIMLALYVYDFETDYTDYVGDTGPVYVQAGRNEYPLVHKNPNITELTSSCVYYASIYLPSASQVNGLYLASCPSYSSASFINATPRFTVGVENITHNNVEIDMTDATTGRLDYNDGQGNYYIGPWSDSYNERPAAPRFFMQVRNGTAAEPYTPAAPFTTLGSAAMATGADLATNLPNFTASSNNSCFRDVTPETDCDITYFEWLDDTSSAAGWAQSNCVFNSGFDTNLSGNNNVVTNIGLETTIDGHNVYRHRLTFGTALHLTANTTYRFLCECFSDTSYVFSRSMNTNTIHVTNNGWYVELNNMTRYNSVIGKYLKVCVDGTDYEI